MRDRVASAAARCLPALLLAVAALANLTYAGGRRGLFIQETKTQSVQDADFATMVSHTASNRLAVVVGGNTIHVLDATTLAESPVLAGAASTITASCFSSDGNSVIAGTGDGTVYVWTVASGALAKTFKPMSVAVVGLDAMKGTQVLVTAKDGNIEVRDWTSGDKVSSLNQIQEEVTCEVLHPSGKWSVFGTAAGRIHVYDIVTSQDVKTVPTTGGRITAMAMSPDGRFLVTGSSDGAVRTWDVGRWILRSSFVGHKGDVTSLAIDGKNRWVVTAARDSAMKIYNLFTGEDLKSSSDPTGYLARMTFVSDRNLCVGLSNGSLKNLLILDAPPDSLPPTVVITRPLVDINTYTARVYEKEYAIEGAAYDDSMVARVTVNGEPVQLFDLEKSDTSRFPPGVKTKGFRTTAKMDSVGVSQVEVKAYDECDNSASLNLNVQRLPADQTIEILAPVDSGGYDKKSTRLKFKLWVDAASFTVTNNLLEITNSREIRGKMPGELISAEIPLVVGYNQIKVTAVGRRGERFSKTVGINRKMSAVASQSTITATQPGKSSRLKGDEHGVGMQRWAVVVGVSKYSNPDIASLNYADADAKSVSDFLQTPEGGGFEADHMQVLLNQDATLAKVRDALFNFVSQAIDSDLVVIYFAGHGAPNPLRPDQLYLLTYDSDPNVLRTTAFPMWDIQTVLERYINARKVVVFTDACHSGGITMEGTRGLSSSKTNPINQYLTNLSKAKDGVVVFTASAQNEVSQELPEFGHGVFTYYLLDGLSGKADLNNDNVVTINELMTYVEVQVKRKTKGYQNPTRSQTNYDKELPMSIVDHQ